MDLIDAGQEPMGGDQQDEQPEGVIPDATSFEREVEPCPSCRAQDLTDRKSVV